MKILGLIPARGGSKGVPRKNIRPLAGRPLIAYTIDAARAAGCLDRVVVSTDDAEIAAAARACGADVPFLRPAEFAGDAAPTLPVVQHALFKMAEAGARFDAVCLLQPTNPLRRAADIARAVALFAECDCDALVSVLPVPHEYNPKWVYFMSGAGTLELATGDAQPVARRQDLPPAFHRDGSIYLTRAAVVLEQNSLYGRRVRPFLMDAAFSANIDTEADWAAAEKRLEEGRDVRNSRTTRA